MTIAEALALIRTIAEGKTVECPRCQGFGSYQMLNRPEEGFGRVCHGCVPPGTGLIPNPAYAAMLEVVRVKCDGGYEGRPSHYMQVVGFGNCVKCDSSMRASYVARDWSQWPDWWLPTLLYAAADRANLDLGMLNTHPSDEGLYAAEAVLAAMQGGMIGSQ